MCILIATTAHPSYALIILDNRDEFVRRPTSLPHWWSTRHQNILSSRDLLRKEQGTWLGITKTGKFAVLTNFREDEDPKRPLQGVKSRGEMVTAWLSSCNSESTEQFVHRMLEGEGVQGVGGFSLVFGKLRRRKDTNQEIEPLAIISNRAMTPSQVPWIAGQRGEAYGLSNTSYDDPVVWPKVNLGKEKILIVVEEAVAADMGEDELIAKLFALLDTTTFPMQERGNIQEHMRHLRNSIFVPLIGQETTLAEIPVVFRNASANVSSENSKALPDRSPNTFDTAEESTPKKTEFMAGIYGTQRQTVILVNWDGNVAYTERALYDARGRAMERGQRDVKFEFQIDGWNGEYEGNEARTLAVL